LLARYPELVEQFDQEANVPATPQILSESSGKLMWWRCRADMADHRCQPSEGAGRGSG
jgi:hypothetical protein